MSHSTDHYAPSSHSFASLGLIDYLQYDTRPTFIIDLHPNPDDKLSEPVIVFWNRTLQNNRALCDLIASLLAKAAFYVDSDDDSDADVASDTEVFFSWLQATPGQESIWFDNFLWSSTCLHRRWLVVSGCHQPTPHATFSHGPDLDLYHNTAVKSERRHVNRFDNSEVSLWQHSRRHPSSNPDASNFNPKSLARAFGVRPTPHNLMVLGFDWAKTTLGPVQSWSQVQQQMIPYLLNGLQPGIILWGSERIMMYNESYVSLIKALHPGALGSSAKIVFGNFWDDEMEHRWLAVEVSGAARHEDTQLFMDRSGFLEETYFTYSLTPLWDAEGRCCGVDSRCFESTRQVVMEARMLSLLKISESIASVTSLDDFWQGLVGAMASHPSEFSLFALYSLHDSGLVSECNGSGTSAPANCASWILRGWNGFPPDHCAIPEQVTTGSDLGFASAFRAVLSSSDPLIFTEGDSVLHPDLLRGCTTPGLKLECHQIVAYPLRLSTRNVTGFLILGINPSRPYDDEYKTFVRLLSRQIETSMSPILSLVTERIESQSKAQKSEHEQHLLITQLEKHKAEVRQSDLRFLKFAEQAPLGVYVLGTDGGVIFANEAWYKMIGIDPSFDGTHAWLLSTHPDDRKSVHDQWQCLIGGTAQRDFEWRALRRIPGKESEIIYLRSSCFPEPALDGTIKSVTGVLMDLSLERAQQHAQEERLKDALDAKKAQEYFMDMVSHEIRNPLHAVLQLAEETLTILQNMRTATSQAAITPNIRDCIENAHTIMYCGHHQKQILDDVLTLSKLNSEMLKLSLTEIAPTSVVKRALKFFDSDIRLLNIDISLDLEKNATSSHYPNVFMDSGRVLQILVNLVGNSIKFMKDRSSRRLTLAVDVTSDEPSGDGLRYLPSGKKYADPTVGAFTGANQVVYIHYSVKDTGPGLTVQGMNLLFERFNQVSPKTHTQYGGSGLGLFISRELAERHGGGIGLSSIVNEGSTFAFYVKCLVAEPKSTGFESTYDTTTPASDAAAITTPVAPVVVGESPRTSQQRTPIMKKTTTILIVEDNIVNQKILNRQLRRLGYETKIANHGAEALSILRKSTWWYEACEDSLDISIVLCDLEMPVMDGMTCVREIRDLQRTKLLHTFVPVVALTGNARLEQISAAKQAGFDHVISKPYAIQTLVSMIERMTVETGAGDMNEDAGDDSIGVA